jgi:hypothetical protein
MERNYKMSQHDNNFDDKPEFELLQNAGKQVDCSRCGAPCMVASKRNLKAREAVTPAAGEPVH